MLALCFIAKQRIDSGFFLFETEQKKKAEKIKNAKNMKKMQEFMKSLDDDFV